MDRILRSSHYRVAEVAWIMGVDPEVVRRWIRNGELGATLVRQGVGGGYRIAHDELERFVRARHPGLTLNLPEQKNGPSEVQ